MIICLEGIDGAGKTAQVNMLAENLRNLGYNPVIAKHLGHTEFGMEIRKFILDKEKQPRSDLAHRLLFWADVVETASACKGKDVVIFDRHPMWSNMAYGIGLLKARGADLYEVWGYEQFCYDMLAIMARQILLPNITILLDVPAEETWDRMARRGELTIIEKRGIDYLRETRKVYLDMARSYFSVKRPVTIVDGTQSKETVAEEIFRIITPLLTKGVSINDPLA